MATVTPVRQTMWERVHEVAKSQTLTQADYRLIEPHLTRPLTWPPIHRRRTTRKVAPK